MNTTPNHASDSTPDAPRKFLVGVLEAFTPPAWLARDDREFGLDSWASGEHYVYAAQRMEAAKLDFVFYHDTLAVQRNADGDMTPALKWSATAPAHDPLHLLPVLAHATEHIGLIGTASTTYDHPFRLARAFSTMDSIAGGRIGWNIVTSFEEGAAANFGVDTRGHDERYERADEFVTVAKRLWEAWEPDAVVADLATDTFVDGSKVHSVDHVGKYYRSRGPLNTQRSPQGSPMLAQAGQSEQGREFAAKHAEFVFTVDAGSVESAKAYRDDIRARAAKHGRDPDDVKVIFGLEVNFTREGADEEERAAVTDAQFGSQLEWWSSTVNLDLSRLPLDEPFPVDTPPSGIHGLFQTLVDRSREGLTIRETIMRFIRGTSNFEGTPEEVAQQIIDFMAAVGGDGVMISRVWMHNAQFLDDMTERLLPALQRAGVTRTEYEPGQTLRQRVLGHD